MCELVILHLLSLYWMIRLEILNLIKPAPRPRSSYTLKDISRWNWRDTGSHARLMIPL